MTTTHFCGTCGAGLESGWTHCARCGGASPDAARAPEPMEPTQAWSAAPAAQETWHQPSPPPRSRGGWVAFGTALAVLVAVGVGAIIWKVKDEDKGASSSTSATTAASTAASTAPTPSPSSVATVTTTATATVAPSATSRPVAPANPNLTEVDRAYFVSPSGNITCTLSAGSAQCEITERNYSMRVPSSCMLSYGDRANLIDGVAGVGCHGDTIQGLADVGLNATASSWFREGTDKVVTTIGGRRPAYALGYGRTLRSGSVDCEMAEDGVRCNDQHTGQGFQLQRDFLNLH